MFGHDLGGKEHKIKYHYVGLGDREDLLILATTGGDFGQSIERDMERTILELDPICFAMGENSYINQLESSVGTYLYGRRMYESMVYWETAHTGG
jgi:hypothetical protein